MWGISEIVIHTLKLARELKTDGYTAKSDIRTRVLAWFIQRWR